MISDGQKSTNFLSLLKDHRIETKEIFKNLSSVFSIFRYLSELSQQFLMRSLRVGNQIKIKFFDAWIHNSSQNRNLLAQSKQELFELKIIKKDIDQDSVLIDPTFMENLKIILTKGFKCPFSKSDNKNIQSDESLKKFSKNKWTTVISKLIFQLKIHEFIVGMETQKQLDKQSSLYKVLESAQLIHQYFFQVDYQRVEILQNRVFSLYFVLPINYFISEYVNHFKNKGQKIEKIIEFILALNNLSPSTQRTADNLPLSKIEQDIINDFYFIGLIWKQNSSSQEFCITHLLQNFSYENSIIDLDFKANFLVETNFRLHVYTVSDFIIKLLQHFCQINYVFPNMIICSINRENVLSAFRSNITSQQLIEFLNKNIDIAKQNKIIDQNKKKAQFLNLNNQEQNKKLDYLRVFQKENDTDNQKTNLPQNVVQQLKLWENEKNLHYSDAILNQDLI